MIQKNLILAYAVGECAESITFTSWKKLHMHLFEHGLYNQFQVFDSDGNIVLSYRERDINNDLHWSDDVPGSVLFEIVNRHASAHL